MRFAVAPEAFKMDGRVHFPATGLVDCVAGFVCALVNVKPFAAERKHFRHEREAFKLAVLIKRRQNFRSAADFDHASG